jgi:hypothetical protein
MKRAVLACAVVMPLVATVKVSPVTYYRDVVPVLQRHCLSCHRPGQIAPISFTSYRQTREWADAIRQVIIAAKMPPWNPVTPGQGDHRLSNSEAGTLIRWVDEGALEGDPKDMPPPAFLEETYLLRSKK